MNTNQKIKEAVRSLNYDKLKIGNLFICTVSDNSKAETAHTVDGTTLNADGSSSGIIGIRLNPDPNDSFLVVPSVNSTVFVIMTTNKEYYLCNWSDIDKFICQITNNISLIGDKNSWIFNDGNNKGLVKVQPLVTELNKRSDRENDIVIALTALAASMTALGSAPVTGTVLGSAITSAISAIVTPVPPTLQSTLENTLVKH